MDDHKTLLKIWGVTVSALVLAMLVMFSCVAESHGACVKETTNTYKCLTADANPPALPIGATRENIDTPYAKFVVNPSGVWALTSSSGSGSGSVTSVTAGNGLTQSGTSTINPTLDVVSAAGTAGSVGTLAVTADAVGVSLGSTSTTAAAGNHGHTAVSILPSIAGKSLQHLRVDTGETGVEWAADTDFNAGGLAGGQTINGGTAAGENLTLSSTANATKGKVILGTLSAYDQQNDRLGIGTVNPASILQIGTPTSANSIYNTATRLRIIGSTAQSGTDEVLLRLNRGEQVNSFYPGTADFRLGSYGVGGAGDGYAPKTKLTISLKNTSTFNEGAEVDILSLFSNGNVGIGTTSPASRIHGVSTLSAATGNEIAYQLNYTTNKATSGNDTGLLINQTDTLSPGVSKLISAGTGGGTYAEKFGVDNAGDVVAGKYNTVAISGTSTPALSVTGTASISNANNGDNAANTTYANDYRAANFVAGTNYEAALGNPSVSGYVPSKSTGGVVTWVANGGGGSGTVTSVTAGAGLTQSGTASVNPTIDVVSHAGSAGTIGTITVTADSVGVNLGTTSTTAAAGNHTQAAATITDFNSAALAASPAETTTTIGTIVSGATVKITPVDADNVGYSDSAAANILKRFTFANLKTYLGGLYAALSHTHAPSDITGTAVVTADSRLSDARTPTAHAVNAATYGYGDATLAGHVRAGTGLTATTGTLAVAYGTTGTTAAVGNDSRLSDARTPTAHASTHVTGGSDVIASVVAAGNAGLMTGADKTKLDGIAAGATVGATWGSNITGQPSTFTPSAHNQDATTITTGVLAPDRLATGSGGQFLRRNAGNTATEFATLAGSGDMVSTNNLSDVANATTARNNLLPSKTGNSLKVLRVNSGETDYEVATVTGGGGGDGGFAFKYAFDTATVGTPAAGGVQFSNATPASVTNLYINETDGSGTTVDTYLDKMQVGNSILLSNADRSKYHLFVVSANFTSGAGVDTVPVTYGFGVGGLFSAAETIYYSMSMAGARDTTGVTGLLKGNGTTTSAATANTDYLPVASPTATGTTTLAALTTSGANISTPGAVTCAHTGVAIPLTSEVVELTTDGDSDQDNCTLAAGTVGQKIRAIIKANGNAADDIKITPSAAFVDGSTSYVFGAAAKGTGIDLVYTSAGWTVVTAYNPGDTTFSPAANGTAAAGTSTMWARQDHVHPSSSGIGAIYRTTGDYTNSTTTPSNITGLSWSIAASTNQTFHCQLPITNSTATSALRFNVNGPASPTRVTTKFRLQTSSATAEAITSAQAFAATAQSSSVTASVVTTASVGYIDGQIQNGANAGTVQIMGAGSGAYLSTLWTGAFCEVY